MNGLPLEMVNYRLLLRKVNVIVRCVPTLVLRGTAYSNQVPVAVNSAAL